MCKGCSASLTAFCKSRPLLKNYLYPREVTNQFEREKKKALFCGVFLHVSIINNEMASISRAGFIWFCALTPVCFCRLERVLSFLLLVSIPQRHETPLYFWCEIKRSWSQSPILWGPEWPCCVTQSLFLLSIHRSML